MVQHPAGLTDCIDDEVGVDVRGVNVRRNEHLIFRPCPGRELLRNGVRQFPGDRLLWVERLGVVVEILRAGFAKLISGG